MNFAVVVVAADDDEFDVSVIVFVAGAYNLNQFQVAHHIKTNYQRINLSSEARKRLAALK